MALSFDTGTLVVLNGPLGVGKSSLACQIVGNLLQQCSSLDGDAFLECNPEPEDSIELMHDSCIALATLQHEKFGINNWVINHLYQSPYEISDIRRRFLEPENGLGVSNVFSFSLFVEEETLRQRIIRRASSISVPSKDWELQTSREEVEALEMWRHSGAVGQFIDCKAPLAQILSNVRDEIDRLINLARSRTILGPYMAVLCPSKCHSHGKSA